MGTKRKLMERVRAAEVRLKALEEARASKKAAPAPKAAPKAKAKAKPKAGLKEVVKGLIGKKEKEELCDKEGCERPAVECEGHVDCNPCEDK